MKRRTGLIGAIILLSLTASALQAAQAADVPEELKGDAVKIQDIIQDEAAYHDKMAVIRGKIDLECGSGCWFIVDDGTAQIYVDILPTNFVIPQKRGSKVKVYGKITTQDGDPMMIGKLVEIDGMVYSAQK